MVIIEFTHFPGSSVKLYLINPFENKPILQSFKWTQLNQLKKNTEIALPKNLTLKSLCVLS